jgi:AcrR family transcriptional regulator
MTKKRTRLPAEQAKKLILDAAERHLAAHGPDGIRLKDLAAELGISHPAILHHFGSRDGLVRAVVTKTSADFEREMIAVITQETDEEDRTARAINGLFELLADRNFARTSIWLQLSSDEDSDPTDHGQQVKRFADVVHALRLQKCDFTPTYQDTLFTIAMASFAIFGASIAPDSVAKAGVDPKQFREWFTKLILRQLESPMTEEGDA